MKYIIHLMLIISLQLSSAMAFAEEKIIVFAASSLTHVMRELTQLYQQTNNAEIRFSFASSSTLTKQIEQGAPADIFISADLTWMDYLLEHHPIKDKAILIKNTLVLIAPIKSTLESVNLNRDTNWNDILPWPQRVAIGDPDHVPAGLYAKESLIYFGHYHQLKKQFASATNVRNALMLVEREEANLGIVYKTDADISAKVKIIATFPSDSHSEIEYPILRLTDLPLAKHFYQFLQTQPAKMVFQKHGFITL